MRLYLDLFLKFQVVSLQYIVQGGDFALQVGDSCVLILISLIAISVDGPLGVPVLVVSFAFLPIDDLLHPVDLLSNQFVLQLQELLVLRLVIFEDVGDGFSVFVEHPEGLVDVDGEIAVGGVDDVGKVSQVAQHVHEDAQGRKDGVLISDDGIAHGFLRLQNVHHNNKINIHQ